MLHQLNDIAAICIGSIYGVLLRYYLSKLSSIIANTDHESILTAFDFGYLFPNIIGCFFMGLLIEYTKTKEKRSLFSKMIGTGFCGSLTSFSTWNQLANLEIVHGDPMDGFLRLLCMYTLSYNSFLFGRHVIIFYNSAENDSKYNIGKEVAIEKSNNTNDDDMKYFKFYFIITILILILLIIFIDKVVWFSILFGCLGALSRSKLSELYNKDFQFDGTLIANILACIIFAIVNILNDKNISFIYKSIYIGFAGALSTVSTFIREIYQLNTSNRLKEAYKYVIKSIIICQILLFTINGLVYII